MLNDKHLSVEMYERKSEKSFLIHRLLVESQSLIVMPQKS